MSAIWIVVGLALTWRMIVLLRRRSRPDWEQTIGAPRLRRCPRRRLHLGDAKRRRVTAGQASDLLGALVAGQHDSNAHLAAGVVLGPGEVAWGRSEARLWVWVSESAWAWRSRVGWWGRRAEGASRQVVVSGWRDQGRIDWLITSARLVGRAPRSGELISIRWSGLSGVQVELHSEAVRVDAANGWRAQLVGPGVAPIAVAAVAACHGTAALGDHPALAALGDRAGSSRPPLSPGPPALGPGGSVLRPWTDRPNK